MITLSAAHGRKYNSIKSIKDDIGAGKDFIIHDVTSPWDGKPCSPKTDLAGQKVLVRYGKILPGQLGMKVTTIKL